jgi:hypothetical protein
MQVADCGDMFCREKFDFATFCGQLTFSLLLDW